MSQARDLIATLKRALKARGLTYADVARDLSLSEASVKRMLSSGAGAITLGRLDALCTLAGLDFAELVRERERSRARIAHLTRQQEAELAGDLRLLLVAVLVRNGWGFEDIVEGYAIDAPECTRLLVRLDRLGLLELQAGNRIRLLLASDFRWLPGGPIERFFARHVQEAFLARGFGGADGLRLYVSAHLTAASAQTVRRRLHALGQEFAELQRTDATLPLGERRNVGLLMATRPWDLGAFEALRRC